MRRHPGRGEAGRAVTAARRRPRPRGAAVGAPDRRRPDVRPVAARACSAPGGCPRPARSILAVNHSHNIDGPMLMGTAPAARALPDQEGGVRRPARPVPARHRPAEGGPARPPTAPRSPTRSACWRDGGVLGIFPEGTRGEGDFASLRAGLAYFAVRSRRPDRARRGAGQRRRGADGWSRRCRRCAAGSTSSSATPSRPATAADGVRAPRWTRPPRASRSSSPRTWTTPGGSPAAGNAGRSTGARRH